MSRDQRRLAGEILQEEQQGILRGAHVEGEGWAMAIGAAR